jgi:uncharacterized small protein (DUF1192 family)
MDYLEYLFVYTLFLQGRIRSLQREVDRLEERLADEDRARRSASTTE